MANPIALRFSISNVISGNKELGGIDLAYSNFTTIADNICCYYDGIQLGASTNNIIENNEIQYSMEGISSDSYSSSNLIRNNTCYDVGTIGLDISSKDDIITENNCTGNYYGIFLWSSSSENTIMWNSFESNNHNARDDGSMNYIDYNYYSNYTGNDSDANGIGDTPHPISGSANNEDLHPLMSPPDQPFPITHTTTTSYSITTSITSSTTITISTTTTIPDTSSTTTSTITSITSSSTESEEPQPSQPPDVMIILVIGGVIGVVVILIIVKRR
jgi:parallel beta-helix repeat protein